MALVFALFALWLCEPALNGELLGDDIAYLTKPYMQELSLANVRVILDPTADPVAATGNYAPVHLLAHLLEHEVFGSYTRPTYGYHAVNAVLHALNGVLFVALLVRQGAPLAAAAVAAALLLVHPANMEVAAWIFQLKTLLALAFGLGALLLLRERPLWATLCFALALLSKATAAAVLPAAALFEWARRGGREAPSRAAWLGLWAALLALYAVPALEAFERTGEFQTVAPPEGVDRVLQALAILGRYLVLAISSYGSSPSHEPPLPESVLDPWVLLGLGTLAGLGTAGVAALRRRHPAAGWLALAGASYLPVAQLFFLFKFPMADRYLYFVLPGLLGAGLLALSPALHRAVAALRREGPRSAPIPIIAALLVLALGVGFVVHSRERTAVFRSEASYMLDAAEHYPNGLTAHMVRARRLVSSGRHEEAIDALEAAKEQGWSGAMAVWVDPAFSPLRGNPRFEALVREMARWWVDHLTTFEDPTQYELIELSRAYQLLGNEAAAVETLERARSIEGTADPRGLRELLRRARDARRSSS